MPVAKTWNEESQQWVPAVVGAQGPIGLQGPQGIQGPEGPEGPEGLPGALQPVGKVIAMTMVFG